MESHPWEAESVQGRVGSKKSWGSGERKLRFLNRLKNKFLGRKSGSIQNVTFKVGNSVFKYY